MIPTCTARSVNPRRWTLVWITCTLLALAGCDSGPGVEEHLAAARDANTNGDFAAAIIAVKNALQEEPSHASGRWLLGRLYLARGQAPEAQKELERASRLGGFGAPVLLDLAEALLMQGDFEEARRLVEDLDPSEHRARRLALLGQAHAGLGAPAKAIAVYGEALSINRRELQAHLGMATIEASRGDLEQAKFHVEAANESVPRHYQALMIRGEIELARDDYDQAREAFDGVLALNPQDPAARLGIVRVLLARGDTDAADEHLNPVAVANPNNPMVNLLRAVQAMQRGDLVIAEGALRSLLEVDSASLRARYMMAVVHFRQREYAQARELLEAYLSKAGGDVDAHKLLASTYIGLREPQRAILVLLRAVRYADKDPQLHAMLGSAYLETGQFEEATPYLEKAAALSPETPQFRAQLALGYAGRGDSDRARDQIRLSVELDDRFVWGDLMLVHAHLTRGEYAAARAAAGAIAVKFPDNPVPANLEGLAWAAEGKDGPAREAFERALSRRSGYGAALLNLGRLAERAGDTASASARYEQVSPEDRSYAQARIALARLVLAGGDEPHSLALLEEARAADSGALEPRLVLTNYYQRVGRHELALPVAEEAYTLAPENPDAALALAKARLNGGALEEARILLQALVARAPARADAHHQLGVAWMRLGQAAEARAAFEATLDREPAHLPAALSLAELALRLGNIRAALTIATGIQKAHPETAAGDLIVADAYRIEGKGELALNQYRKVLARAPSGPVLITLSRLQRETGDGEAAHRSLVEWVQGEPQDIAARVELARSHLLRDEHHDAAREYERVLARVPTHLDALNNLAWLYGQRGDERALEVARHGHELAPENAELLDTYGGLLSRSGAHEQAIVVLEKATRLAPKRNNIRNHLAAARARASGDETTLAALEAVSQRPHDARAHIELGSAVLARGETDGA